tara:strand:+ start:279 stop:932 length:654 start_codon:yes stop_codon:yes gene_type:complete
MEPTKEDVMGLDTKTDDVNVARARELARINSAMTALEVYGRQHMRPRAPIYAHRSRLFQEFGSGPQDFIRPLIRHTLDTTDPIDTITMTGCTRPECRAEHRRLHTHNYLRGESLMSQLSPREQQDVSDLADQITNQYRTSPFAAGILPDIDSDIRQYISDYHDQTTDGAQAPIYTASGRAIQPDNYLENVEDELYEQPAPPIPPTRPETPHTRRHFR